MIVQEAGVAVGWPLGLGYDTTGFPLGLRLRLTQEDLQWPRDPDLTRSQSSISEDSSSLDTLSTRSFFQDKSISLGTLMGLPMDHLGNRHHQGQQEHDHPAALRNCPNNAAIASTSSSPVRQPRKAKKKQHHPSAASSGPGTPLAAASSTIAASWNFLNVLSCARMPAGVEGVNEAAIISIPRAELVVREIEAAHYSLVDHDLELQEEHINRSTGSAATRAIMQVPISKISLQQQQLNSRGRKLYENITFEDDVRVNRESCNSVFSKTGSGSSDIDGSPSSKELNPLFTCSSLEAQDEEDEYGIKAHESSLIAGMTADHHDTSTTTGTAAATLTKSKVFYIERDGRRSSLSMHSRLRTGSSTSRRDSLDARKQQQPLGNRNEFEHSHTVSNDYYDDYYGSQAVSRSDQEFSRNKAVSLFVSRMRLNRSMRTSRQDGAWLKTCIGTFSQCRSLWLSIFHTPSVTTAGEPRRHD